MQILTNNIVNDGLVLYLDAGIKGSYPGSGTTWTDLAQSNDGTLTNGPTFDSANGGSIVFDGSDDHIALTNSNTGTGAFTLCMWVKFDTVNSAAQNLFSFGNFNVAGTTWTESFVNTSSNGDLYFRVRKDSTTYFFINTGAGGVTTNWQMLSYVFTNTTENNAQKIYVNTTEKAAGTSTTGGLTRTNSYNTLFARNSNASISNFFDGSSGMTMLYDRSLSAAEINQNFEATRHRFGI